jgi:hypothetical protein
MKDLKKTETIQRTVYQFVSLGVLMENVQLQIPAHAKMDLQEKKRIQQFVYHTVILSVLMPSALLRMYVLVIMDLQKTP